MDYKAENEAKKLRIKKIKETKGKLLGLKRKIEVKERITAFKNSFFSSTRKTALFIGTFLMSSGPIQAHPNNYNNSERNDDLEPKTELPANVVETPNAEANTFLYESFSNILAEEVAPEVSIDELKTEVINAHIEGSIHNAYEAFVDVKKRGRKALSKRYPDTYNRERNSYYYCLRSQTKAIEEYASQNNVEYMNNVFASDMNLAGCAQFCEQITKENPDVIYGKKYVSPKAKKVSYSPISLYPEDIKVGDIILLKSEENNISGLHAVRSIGHEYDEVGNITSCIMISLNTESFRRLGTKGVYSTVSIPDYEKNRIFETSPKNTKGMVIHIADLMDKALNSEIEKHYTDNMNEKEKDSVARDVINNYIASIDLENSNSTLYNKTGDDFVQAINKEETTEVKRDVEKNDSNLLTMKDAKDTINMMPEIPVVQNFTRMNVNVANNPSPKPDDSFALLKQRLNARKEDEYSDSIAQNDINSQKATQEHYDKSSRAYREGDIMNMIISNNQKRKS